MIKLDFSKVFCKAFYNIIQVRQIILVIMMIKSFLINSVFVAVIHRRFYINTCKLNIVKYGFKYRYKTRNARQRGQKQCTKRA